MFNTQRQVALLGQPQKTDLLKEEQVRELQGQLEALRAKMHRMETLEKNFSEIKKQLEVRVLPLLSHGGRTSSSTSWLLDGSTHFFVLRWLAAAAEFSDCPSTSNGTLRH